MENSNKQISFIIDNIDPSNPAAVLDRSNETKIVDGIEWNIRVQKKHYDGGRPKLEINIDCNEQCTDKLWLAQAVVQIWTKGNGFGVNDRQNFNCDFSNGNANFRTECEFYSAVRQVEIEIHVCRSFPSLMEFDTNLEIVTLCDVQGNGRNVEKHSVIAVNKHALAAFSNYFRNLFFGNWAERRQQQNEITAFTIKEEANFDIEAFTKMIYASMSMGWIMGDSFFELLLGPKSKDDKDLKYKMAIKILKLSVKYDLPMIQNCCEEYFTSQSNDKYMPKMEVLEEAENLGLQKLKERTLKSISAMDFALNFGKNLDILGRLGKRTQEELIKEVENNAKQMQGSDFVVAGGSSRGWDDDNDGFGNNGFGRGGGFGNGGNGNGNNGFGPPSRRRGGFGLQ